MRHILKWRQGRRLLALIPFAAIAINAASLLAIAAAENDGAAGSGAPPLSWEQLSKRLANDLPTVLSGSVAGNRSLIQALLRRPYMHALAEHGGLSTFNEMAGHGELGMVSIAGALLAQEKYPHQAMCASCVTVMRGDALSFAADLMTDYLQAASPDDQQALDGFSAALRTEPSNWANIVALTSLLPRPFLEKWWQNRPEDILVSNEAAVAMALLDSSKNDLSPALKKSIQQRVAAYADVPGLPQWLYVSIGDPPKESLEARARALLADKSVPDAALIQLFYQYKTELSSFDFAASPDVPAARVDYMKQVLHPKKPANP